MLTSCRSSFYIGGLIVAFGLLSGCGGGTYDSTEVVQGRAWKGEITTEKDGGKPITGTVVKKNAKGDVIEEVQYKDGLPNGPSKEWYDNGQLKSEVEVAWDPEFKRTKNLGTSRAWCENGTLKSESTSDDKGAAIGKSQQWSCTGKLLNLSTYPEGDYVTGNERENGDVVITEQGYKLADPTRNNKILWKGVHKKFNLDGKPLLSENWVNGQLDGPYETWDMNGNPQEKGTYAAGKKVGLWTRYLNGFGSDFDYDANNFMNPDYAGAFMQAAGIQATTGGHVPLQEYKVDLEKIKYYVSEGLIDPKKKINLAPQGEEFVSSYWTYAYVRASSAALNLLVELGADPKASDTFGRSRLHYCMISLMDNAPCSVAEAQRLLSLGIAPDQPDKVGDTPLNLLIANSVSYYMGGTSAEKVSAVSKLLVDAGASPDTKGSTGLSPLMNAVLQKKFDTATYLLEHSKNPTATSKDGFNLIQLAFLSMDQRQFDLRMNDALKSFVQLAVNKGVDPNQKAGDMGSMKEIALQAGAIDVAQYLSSLKSQ